MNEGDNHGVSAYLAQVASELSVMSCRELHQASLVERHANVNASEGHGPTTISAQSVSLGRLVERPMAEMSMIASK